MTDRQFVKACLKISEKWGKIKEGDFSLELRKHYKGKMEPFLVDYGFTIDEAWNDAARLCAEWLEEQVLKCKCLISRHYSDNRITLGDCSLEFSNTDYRTALLSAATALIAKEKR